MSDTRIPAYFRETIEFFPELLSKGSCFGHAHMAKQALLAGDFQTFLKRIFLMRNGCQEDLLELAKKLNLELSETSQVEFKDEIKSIVENTHQECNVLKEAFKQLLKSLQFEVKEQTSSLPETKRNQTLRKQTDLAWRMTESHLRKEKKLIINENKNANEKEIRTKLAEKLKEFQKTHAGIKELIDIDIYMANLALYHEPSHFMHLLPERDKFIDGQNAERIMPFTLPVELDDKDHQVETICQFSTQYTSESIKNYFSSLKKAIEAEIKEIKNLNNTAAELPFVLILGSQNHSIAIGYNYKTKNWILSDFNDGMEKEDIAEDVFKALLCIPNITYCGKETAVKLGFNKNNNEFILLDTTKTTTSSGDEKIAKALTQSSKIRQLDSIKLNVTTQVYTIHKHKQWANRIIQNWHNSTEFTNFYKTPVENKDDKDAIHQQSLLIFAIQWGDIKKVDELIQLKVDVNQSSSLGNPVIQASLLGDSTILKKLIAANASIHEKLNGEDALYQAAVHTTKYPFEIVQTLVNAKANPNSVNSRGIAALATASRYGFASSVFALLECKADPNLISKEGMTALYLSVNFGHIETTKMLLAYGATFTATGTDCLTPFFPNIVYHEECIPFYGRAFFSGAFLAFLALREKQFDVLNLLIEFGANLNDTLLLTCFYGTAEQITTLIEKKADPNSSLLNANQQTMNALDIAMHYQKSQPELIKQLIRFGAKILNEASTLYTNHTLFKASDIKPSEQKAEPSLINTSLISS